MFLSEYIQDIACRDEDDRQIFWELHGAGESGILPTNIAAMLGDRRFTRFYVTARFIQMSKKIDVVLGQHVSKKRGKNWALSSIQRWPISRITDTHQNHSQLASRTYTKSR